MRQRRRNKGGRKGTAASKNPLIQHCTNVLDHGTLFSNTINIYKTLAFLNRIREILKLVEENGWGAGNRNNIGNDLL